MPLVTHHHQSSPTPLHCNACRCPWTPGVNDSVSKIIVVIIIAIIIIIIIISFAPGVL
jgi:hypothetical protein